MEFIQSLDDKIVLWFQSIRMPWLDGIMKFFTHLGDGSWVWILIFVLFLIFKSYRSTAIKLAIAMIIVLIVNNLILKNVFHRIRPYDLLDQFTAIIKKEVDWSFPSGHTAFAAAAVYVIARRLGGVLAALAIVVGFFIAVSRIYVGVHFLTDVLAGAVIGVICGWVGWIVGGIICKLPVMRKFAP